MKGLSLHSKALSLTIFLVFVTTSIFSQDFSDAFREFKNGYMYSNYYTESFYEEQQGLLTSKKRSKLGIKKIVITNKSKNDKPRVTELSYNSKGKLVHSKSNKFERKSEYISDTLENYRFTSYKGKTKENKRSYLGKEILTDERLVNGKQVSFTSNEYTDFGKIKYSKFTGKRNLFEMKYTYNDQNKLIRSEYLKNGKVKQSWVYECKEQGELLTSSKNELLSSVCTYREESSDGSYSVFTRSIVDGKVRLNKNIFSKDSVLIGNEYYEKDSVLIRKWSNKNGVDINENYKKGKLDRSWVKKYNSNKQVIESSFLRKGKLINKSTFTYDELGNNIVKEDYYGKKMKLKFKYVNSFNENKTKKQNLYYKKGKLMREQNFTYEF
jgi:hypothetical protein